MKLTAHINISFPLLYIPGLRPMVGGLFVKNKFKYHVNGNKCIAGWKSPSRYHFLHTCTSLDRVRFVDNKKGKPASIEADKNILSSTTLSKASGHLPSLATGVYFVRVKNKVRGEATNLRFAKI